jgi:MFS transporter, PAT family, solute carrier family 33 (acetyl-CoA transportor), member 1
MSARRNKSSSKQPKLRKHKEDNKSDEDMPTARPMAVSSGLNAIHIAPRTPRISKLQWNGVEEDDTQEVELSLLDEEERLQAARGLGQTEEQGYVGGLDSKHPLSAKDQRGMALLIVLCEHNDFVMAQKH